MAIHIATDTDEAARIINSQVQYYYIDHEKYIRTTGSIRGNEQGGLVC